MPPQIPAASARSIADFFALALSSFQRSGSKLSIVCTAPLLPPLCRGGGRHDEAEVHNGRLPALRPPRVRPGTLIVLDSSFNPPTRAHLRMATSAVHNIVRKQGGQEGLSGLRFLLLLSVKNADKGVKPASFEQRMVMMWAFARELQCALSPLQCQNGEAESSAPSETGDGHGQKRNPAETETLSVDIGLSTAPYFHDKSDALAELAFYSGNDNNGDSVATEQIFLVGYDTLIRILNPKYYYGGSAVGPAVVGQAAAAESSAEIPHPEETAMQKALGPFFSRAKLRVSMRLDKEWGGPEDQTAFVENLLRAGGVRRGWGDRIELVEGRPAGSDAISSTYARAAAKERDWDKLDSMVPTEVRWWIEREGLYA
ncbi:hypothetical protein N658DRAFT_424822 [Parathielavia hyrcaniae]|uniref:Nicotinamide-nucleotide adenylyltransferase n=1 Tax=Parathielavia hyrcaniae TaxID=113614 RepID=A0AAN6Q2T7_9PEZI|nr:hypothetical protein N658DRAFT_424822 [Parathielavia hyrcaniae]